MGRDRLNEVAALRFGTRATQLRDIVSEALATRLAKARPKPQPKKLAPRIA
ncbi:MAG: hypothetical protein AAF371_08770 [Pseudomonadota bacterium]